jgi:hypothetical protein
LVNTTTPRCGGNTGVFLGSATLVCAALAGVGCGSAGNRGLYGDDFSPLPSLAPDAGAGGSSSEPIDSAGVPVRLSLTSPALDQLQAELASARAENAAQLLAEHELPFQTSLGYSAVAAKGLELIQASPLSITDDELALLGRKGFVIVPRQEYPSFPYAYSEIYAQDLPVFVSADMVLEAVHRSYDQILEALEQEQLRPRLASLLSSLRARLARPEFAADAALAADLDLYLTVAQRLLDGTLAAPVRGADPQQVGNLVGQAQSAGGSATVELFGRRREIDFSQFAPRGHYADSEPLSRYFRAMIWFGRTDLRLIETQADGTRVFLRRQLDAALALRELMDEASLADWTAIDTTIGAFVGEHDDMTVPELGALLGDLGVGHRAELAALPDARIAQAIVDGRYGDQRILSQVMIENANAASPLPLDASFALFGQRYVVDSHVFSNVVFDRVSQRVLPSPLDVAFAALGNDQALSLIGPELDQSDYPGALSSLRTLVDAQGVDYWNGSLYSAWLGALRTLSPGAAGNALSDASLPSVARGETWGRRLLNTQLASWAELRHDTVLYAKQSYTTGSLCEYPDALVEPYPEFFHALARYADLGQTTVDALGVSSADPNGETLRQLLHDYFARLSSVMNRLGRMAEAQRTGAEHAPDDIAFINQAITIQNGCAGPSGQSGWYQQLYFDNFSSIEEAPTIADVHTDPGGQAPVSRGPSVLHVATGRPRLMVLAVDSCSGPRAYVGAVSDYQEHVNGGLHRFTDAEWSDLVTQGVRWEPSWMAPTQVSD